MGTFSEQVWGDSDERHHGVGVALAFPLALSAAGDDPHGAARRVSLVAGMGYVAFLIGPPGLGTLGQHIGLLHAFIPAAAIVGVAALIAGSVRAADSALQSGALPQLATLRQPGASGEEADR